MPPGSAQMNFQLLVRHSGLTATVTELRRPPGRQTVRKPPRVDAKHLGTGTFPAHQGHRTAAAGA